MSYYDSKIKRSFFCELSEEDQKNIIDEAGFFPLKKDVVAVNLSYKGELEGLNIERYGEVIAVLNY